MLVISGGGTGGHFFPALAFMEFLSEKGEKALYVGSERGIERKYRGKIPVESLFLEVYPFAGMGLLQKLRALKGYLSGALQVGSHLAGDFKTLLFGGYVSVPAGLYTLFKKKPLYIHEQNSVPSNTNRFFSKRAHGIFITFEYTRKYFRDAERTGIPLRTEAKRKLPKEEARKLLELDGDRTVVLVMGGSQGAVFLNELAVEVAKRTPYEVLLVCGERNYPAMKELGIPNLRVLPFYEEVGVLYSASDVAISRAGASTISELSYHGLPSLFIPYPYAAEDHQYYNAKEIEDLGGGLVIRQEKARPEEVLNKLEKLIGEREKFSKGMKEFRIEDPCERMYEGMGE